MGVGKTTVSRELQNKLNNCVFLDGDWCWDSKPFLVKDNTKNMVMENIVFLLNNFLSCPDYDNIIFCWVMHEQSIIDEIKDKINHSNHKLNIFTLTISENALKKRILKDVELGFRKMDAIRNSLSRLEYYDKQNNIKIDVSSISPQDVAEEILKCL